MKGLYFTRKAEIDQQPAHPQMDALKLLAKQGSLEIMHQHILRGANVWLTPLPSHEDIEFFYICKGSLHYKKGDDVIILQTGDSFHTRGLDGDVVFDILEDTDLLYVSTIPVFDANANYQSELFNLLRQIDEKDHYTLQHSVNVRNYSMQLWSALPQRHTGTYGDMVVASLFHDVGKINIPDSILKKPYRCTDDEFTVMKMHAVYSGELLSEHFPGKAVLYAKQHHERLDGSGYPGHIPGDQLCFESRVIALADTFDAMTSKRVYQNPRSMEDAAAELCTLTHLYDEELVYTLKRLVQSGMIAPTKPVQI